MADTQQCHAPEESNPFINLDRLSIYCPLNKVSRKFQNPMLKPQRENEVQSAIQNLPIEIYQACLSCLDTQSLSTMRRVSQYTRATVNSIHEYQELYKHAPYALRAVLYTGVAAHIPLSRLHDSLTSMKCHYCEERGNTNRFGAYLSLYEGRRCCLVCVNHEPRLRPINLKDLVSLCCAPRKPSISLSSIKTLPRLRVLPGFYGPHRERLPDTTILVLPHTLTSPLNPNLTDREQDLLFGSDRKDLPFHHPFMTREQESDISSDPGYLDPDETPKKLAYRYASIVEFPYLTSQKTRDYGVFCLECNLRMRFKEEAWKEELQNRRRWNRNAVASERRRQVMSMIRLRGCEMFLSSKEGMQDAIRAANTGDEYSLEVHHKAVKHEITDEEKEWRKKFGTTKSPVEMLELSRFA